MPGAAAGDTQAMVPSVLPAALHVSDTPSARASTQPGERARGKNIPHCLHTEHREKRRGQRRCRSSRRSRAGWSFLHIWSCLRAVRRKRGGVKKQERTVIPEGVVCLGILGFPLPAGTRGGGDKDPCSALPEQPWSVGEVP